LRKKQDGFLDKDKTMDNVQEHSNHMLLNIWKESYEENLQSCLWRWCLEGWIQTQKLIVYSKERT
jgi:hypothetical protein